MSEVRQAANVVSSALYIEEPSAAQSVTAIITLRCRAKRALGAVSVLLSPGTGCRGGSYLARGHIQTPASGTGREQRGGNALCRVLAEDGNAPGHVWEDKSGSEKAASGSALRVSHQYAHPVINLF